MRLPTAGPDTAVIGIAGDFDSAEMRAVVEAAFQDWTPQDGSEPQDLPAYGSPCRLLAPCVPCRGTPTLRLEVFPDSKDKGCLVSPR